jgi:hypothetical protein
MQPNAEYQSQCSEYDLWLCIYVNWEEICLQLFITKVLAAVVAEWESDTRKTVAIQ